MSYVPGAIYFGKIRVVSGWTDWFAIYKKNPIRLFKIPGENVHGSAGSVGVSVNAKPHSYELKKLKLEGVTKECVRFSAVWAKYNFSTLEMALTFQRFVHLKKWKQGTLPSEQQTLEGLF
jgi:hypothetical protein